MALLVGLTSLFGWFGFAHAEMTSTNYQIRWDTVSSGGSDTGSSSSYLLRDTVGGTGVGDSSSASYQATAGYRAGIDDELFAFEVLSQVAVTEVSATSLVGTTVDVSGVSGYAAGDFIAVVQDKGAAQVTAIGKIASVGVSSITVEAFVDGGVSPTVDGTNDYVYELSGATLNLGQLDVAEVATSVIGFNVTAAMDSGYTVQAATDGLLRHAGNDIDSVADGAVTAGDEEYGGRSSDTSVSGSTFDTQDTAFTTSFQPVIDVAAISFDDLSFVTLKASMSIATPNDNYAQVLSLILSPNF